MRAGRIFTGVLTAALLSAAPALADGRLSSLALSDFMVEAAELSGLPLPARLPEVLFVTGPEIDNVAYGAQDQPGQQAAAVYDTTSATIYLNTAWGADPIRDASTLIHELVHHLQFEAGADKTYPCRQWVERVAYKAQADWLAARDFDFYEITGIGKMTHIVVTNCLVGGFGQ